MENRRSSHSLLAQSTFNQFQGSIPWVKSRKASTNQDIRLRVLNSARCKQLPAPSQTQQDSIMGSCVAREQNKTKQNKKWKKKRTEKKTPQSLCEFWNSMQRRSSWPSSLPAQPRLYIQSNMPMWRQRHTHMRKHQRINAFAIQSNLPAHLTNFEIDWLNQKQQPQIIM